ncbi:MAG: enolase C-terminal domain-like protein [Armatimonadota bacterium]|nr:enolase C-terminal domain-like protein [Armatimonadota bacterium]MDR7500387.1 enolase C-terminal domain-like protein [Armatimonadota bacterium]MDR7548049.1 enolase C-terminal domain-like protein [Armatimonadota bacterium]
MRISKITAVKVIVPIEAPLRHSYGVHEAFARTLVRVFTDEGLTGLGETSARLPTEQVETVGARIVGEDPFDLERIRMKISHQGYYTRHSLILGALEMACLDLQGKAMNLPAFKLLGGAFRNDVPVAGYLFYRYPQADQPGVATSEEMVEHARDLVARYGFGTLKLKGGVLRPETEIATVGALREAFGSTMRLRFDPNGVWTPETAISAGMRLEAYDLEYYEDPTWGIAGMAAVRRQTRIPIATNMCVVDFDQFAPAVQAGAVDIILSDLWYWGGLHATKILARMCQTFGLGIGMHSGIELGIGLAAMLHLAVTIPNLTHAIDVHYHHLRDDVISGGLLKCRDGMMRPPEGPGLGVALDEERVARYRLRETSHDRGLAAAVDPFRPEWFPTYPSW